MTADVVDIDEPVTAHRPRAPRIARYQLDVLGADVADVVTCAGGWLFDRVMAGWEVTVAVPRLVDPAPLQILGVHPVTRATPLDAGAGALAVAGALCHTDSRVRDLLGAALRSARTEITLWGAAGIVLPGGRGIGVRHELSTAARVFKAQALAAVGACATAVEPFEAFVSHGRAPRTEHPDLLPA